MHVGSEKNNIFYLDANNGLLQSMFQKRNIINYFLIFIRFAPKGELAWNYTKCVFENLTMRTKHESQLLQNSIRKKEANLGN
jgi:hypothetical protein